MRSILVAANILIQLQLLESVFRPKFWQYAYYHISSLCPLQNNILATMLTILHNFCSDIHFCLNFGAICMAALVQDNISLYYIGFSRGFKMVHICWCKIFHFGFRKWQKTLVQCNIDHMSHIWMCFVKENHNMKGNDNVGTRRVGGLVYLRWKPIWYLTMCMSRGELQLAYLLHCLQGDQYLQLAASPSTAISQKDRWSQFWVLKITLLLLFI